MRDRIVVSDASAASVFSNMRQRRLLLELVAREYSLQEIALKANLALNLAHYHVARLLDLGLVETTREQPRSGRVIKRYRAAARSFFVPTHLGSPSSGKQLAVELRASLDRAHVRDPKDGTLYFVDDALSPRMRRMPSPASAAEGIESWHQLVLTKEQARALADELKALLSRYEGRANGKARSYLAYCALTPRARQGKRIGT